LKYHDIFLALIQEAIHFVSDDKMMGFSIPDSLVVEWQTAALVLTGILIVTSVAQSILSYRRLREFDGPLWAKLSQTWLFHKTLSGGLYLTLADVSRKYGEFYLTMSEQSSRHANWVVEDDIDLYFEQDHWHELAQICSSRTTQHCFVVSVQLDHLILEVHGMTE